VAPEDISASQEWPAEVATGDLAGILRAGEQRFRQQFGRVPVGMLVTSLIADRPNAYLAVNETFCQLSGYTPGELGRADFLGDIHPDDQPALEILIHSVVSGETDQIQANVRLVREDGGIVFVHLTGSAIQPPAGERYLAIFIEDTNRKCSSRAAPRTWGSS